MFYSESLSESDFNSPSDSESDFSSVFMNLDICIFLPYVFILLNKLGDDFFLSIVKTESIVMHAMQIKCIFSSGISLPKKYPNSFTLAFKYLFS